MSLHAGSGSKLKKMARPALEEGDYYTNIEDFIQLGEFPRRRWIIKRKKAKLHRLSNYSSHGD